MIQQTGGIGDRLKEETKELHASAESHEFQRAFGSGKLPREGYVRYLSQMYLVHRALEAKIKATQGGTPELSDVISDRNFRETDLEADLRYFGVDPATVTPTKATSALIARFETAANENPDTLLGYHYVLEGSNNGNAFIARGIRKAYGLSGTEGTRYLDPYGDQQRPMWMQYKQAMAALTLTDEQADRIVESAKELFRAVGQLSGELAQPVA